MAAKKKPSPENKAPSQWNNAAQAAQIGKKFHAIGMPTIAGIWLKRAIELGYNPLLGMDFIFGDKFA